MPTIKGFAQYSEHEVINLYAFSGATPTNKGTFVRILGSGWRSDVDPSSMIGAAGKAYGNTVAQRYAVNAKVGVAATGDVPLGMLLYDVKETDENGEKLLFRPRKAAEMCVTISGQASPILLRGIVLYSGIDGAVTAGNTAYVSGGSVTTTNVNSEGKSVGKFLGTKDANGFALLKVNL